MSNRAPLFLFLVKTAEEHGGSMETALTMLDARHKASKGWIELGKKLRTEQQGWPDKNKWEGVVKNPKWIMAPPASAAE